MTIYVDDIRKYDNGPWCHMWCDGNIDELHQMANRIGLKRDWFQQKDARFPHYDLRPTKRDAALRAGAEHMPLREWISKGMGGGASKAMVNGRVISCPNCDHMARLIKVERSGMVYRCEACQAVTVKTSDQPYTE